MVDDDFGLEPEPDDEAVGAGEEMGVEAFESHSLFLDQLAGPGL